MKNRLQIKYYMPNFPYSRENAIKFIEKLFSRDAAINPYPKTSLPAEPIAVFYGDNAMESNVILAIGRHGDGKDYRNNAPYFLIDTANINESISELGENLDKVTKLANQAKSDIELLKLDIKAAQDDIISIWAKIGAETDTIERDTVYGYINDKFNLIMGGIPVDGFTTINEIGAACANFRQRLNNIKNANNKLAERVGNLESKVDGNYTEQVEWKRIIDDAIIGINDKIGGIPENTTVAQYIENEEKRAQEVETQLREAIELNAKEITKRETEDEKIRNEFIQADKDALDSLSLKWVKYTDGSGRDEIQLLINNQVQSYIDVAEFIKDGILEDVKLLTVNDVKVLRFIWNVDAGEQVIDVEVSELIDVYTAGKGLELNGSEFSIKLSDKNENNFLVVAEDGIRLSGIEAFVDGKIEQVENSYKEADNQLNSEYNKLQSKILELETLLGKIADRIDDLSLKVDMDKIKGEVVPLAVEESKKAIISSDIFKGIEGEITVNVNSEMGTITYGFDEDAVFMADYNIDNDTDDPDKSDL